jgi:hypothetical protein
MSRFSAVALTLLALSVALPAAAASYLEVTPFVGYQFGGELTDYQTGFRYRLQDNGNFGVSLDMAMDPHDDTWFELRWSHQESELKTTIPELERMDIDIDYFHIGGLQEFQGENDHVIPFCVGTLGATHINPNAYGLSSATRFSLGLGGGVKLMSGGPIGLRLEARLLGTYFGSNAAFICGSPGGCAFGINGTMLLQGEVTIGLIFRARRSNR